MTPMLQDLDVPLATRAANRLWRHAHSGQIRFAQEMVSESVVPHTLALADPRASFQFEYTASQFGTTTLSDFSYSSDTLIEARLPPTARDCYLLIVPVQGHAVARYAGRDYALAPGTAMMFGPNGDLTFRDSPPRWRNLDIRIDRRHFEFHAAATNGYTAARPIQFTRRALDIVSECESLLRLLMYLLNETRASDSTLAQETVAIHLEQALYATVLETIPNDLPRRAVSFAAEPVSKIVVEAERYMIAHAADPLSIDVVAAAINVKSRTLHKAFRASRNYTPLEFLTAYRLDLAHTRLRDATTGTLTVTEVALACGFSHLSKFAASYKARFGESPRTTLKRIRAPGTVMIRRLRPA